MDVDDTELLRQYAATGGEREFAAVVRRQVNFVYSAALRQVNGDAHLAQDVTQLVFTDLARKAAQVAEHRVLAGWLFTSTRYAAAKLIRAERRRQAREAKAQLMDDITRDPAAPLDWARVRPVLDEVIGELDERDREAVLLRFFEGRDFATVGARLRLTENAARMRVERALDKLHAQLARRGVTSTTAALAAALTGQAVMAAPAGLAATVTGTALAGGGALTAGTAAGAGLWATFMSMTKLQIAIGGALAVAGVTGLALQGRTNAALNEEVAALRAETAALATARAENIALARTAAEIAEMKGDDAALARLNDEAAALKAKAQQVARAEQAAAARRAVVDTSGWDRMPSPRHQTRPDYPAELRAAGVSGEVIVEFVVDAEGNVQNARALQTELNGQKIERSADSRATVRLSPFTVTGRSVRVTNIPPGGPNALFTVNGLGVTQSAQLLETAALAAVAQWKFAAGTKGGRNVNTSMQMPIVFTLGDDNASDATQPKAGP